MYATKVRLLALALTRRDAGSVTIEYAWLVIGGVALAAILLTIVRSDAMRDFLTGLMIRDTAQ